MTDDDLTDVQEMATMNGVGATAEQTDALVTEVRRLRAIAEWAQDAPHHDGCLARHNGSPQAAAARPYPCKCGRDEVMP